MPEDDSEKDSASPSETARAAWEAETRRSQYLYQGMILKERYILEGELARGGIGVVYMARDQNFYSRRVVIKVLREEMRESDQTIWVHKKFRQEMEALALIDHPGVVGALDAGEMPDGRPFLVMQFVEGKNLRSQMPVQGMELARVADIVRQLGQALSAAHDKGIIHRDLKPENIMIQTLGGGEEHAKLIDFGIATVKDSQVAANSDTTRVAGTFAYMAPEQLKGHPSAASDIYALGVIAYEMVTGQLPFNAASVVDLYEMQQRGVKVKPREHRYSLPDAAQEAILKALSFNATDRYFRARDFGKALASALTGNVESSSPRLDEITQVGPPRPGAEVSSAQDMARVVLLYKRHAKPDEEVLKLLETGLLSNGYKVFIDRHLSVGMEWAREIERQIQAADACIMLLSAASVTSEMLAYEVQIAHDAAQKQHGRPRLLPIRINYEDPLPDPVGGILNHIQYALWTGPQDNEQVVADLIAALKSSPESQPTLVPQKLEAVGGAVPLDSEFYILRPTDEDFHAAIARRDSIVLVKGARQMGKTSLLARGLQHARGMGAKVVLTDFQKLNAAHLESVETLFMTLAELIADQLDLDVLPDEVWNARRGPSMNFERYIRREVLGKIECPLVWGLDEVDRLFTCDYGSEVFGLFRSWHNERSLDPTGPWERMTLAIAYATEAHLFITDINQSPFNVGTRLVLDDFTFEQVAELNRRHGLPLKGTDEVMRFFRLLNGQPYLVRKGLHELAAHGGGLAAFEEIADRDEGPFGDHLRRILVLLAQDEQLCNVVRGVLLGQPCPTSESFYRLRSAGLMSGDSAKDVKPRCELYATYLKRHLI
ncbi:MAG: AAA-like domain-containing protein [Blastocatellia bacterium]|nr:AAA-like domain-containing protein [Blastocatellia bacterium]